VATPQGYCGSPPVSLASRSPDGGTLEQGRRLLPQRRTKAAGFIAPRRWRPDLV